MNTITRAKYYCKRLHQYQSAETIFSGDHGCRIGDEIFYIRPTHSHVKIRSSGNRNQEEKDESEIDDYNKIKPVISSIEIVFVGEVIVSLSRQQTNLISIRS